MVPQNLNLYLRGPVSWRSLAETILDRRWSEAEAEEWPQTQPWQESRIWVGDSRPIDGDPVVTDLGIDHHVHAAFILNKERAMYDQVSAALRAAGKVWEAHGGVGALLYEHDDVMLRWSDERLVVNELSSFKDHAVEVLGPAVELEPIRWE